ncbi:serine hydrolase domain-containing protein [Kibdelosporangium phytohabitans]|uniref:Peptidase n=1 Tax=Kibdelosporangium phytohabitans TaxID=860235 RepID=A0A0N9ICW7_9PSEU|nr:serine hydrolase domain-containing protein [Kibdelosporangium phytohabitans]ALG14304.1 peptidase [Kibdelosporangium phytohabitans]MBE1466686.1 D-alanyl-D-alanine carboxypeptidase [Kibdelosporangium phytohabitans]
MRKTVVALAAAVAVGVSALPAQAATLPPPNDTLLTAALEGLPDAEATGALVRITGSAGRWQGTAGKYDIDKGGPIRPDGRFRIGSVTKVYTAVLVLKLADKGRIDLNQPVQRYLPGVLPADYPPIPVYTLLDHTAGLPHVDIPQMGEPRWVLEHRFDNWTPRQVLDTVIKQPTVFTPGTAQRYSNSNYIVAGLLAEQVTGKSYARLVREWIADPLGLCHTYYPEADPRLPGPTARGYFAVDGELHDVTEMNQSIPWAAGGLISTAPELDTFISALLRGRLLGKESMTRLFTVPKVKNFDDGRPANYSQGLQTETFNGVTVWGKTGTRYGYASGVFATRPQPGTGRIERTAVYSVNATDKSTTGPGERIRRIADAATR